MAAILATPRLPAVMATLSPGFRRPLRSSRPTSRATLSGMSANPGGVETLPHRHHFGESHGCSWKWRSIYHEILRRFPWARSGLMPGPRPADTHGNLLSPRSRLSRKLAHAAFLQMSNVLALEFGLPVIAAAAFAAQLPYATLPDGSPGLRPGAFSTWTSTFPLAVLWVRGELRMLRLTWVTRREATCGPSL